MRDVELLGAVVAPMRLNTLKYFLRVAEKQKSHLHCCEIIHKKEYIKSIFSISTVKILGKTVCLVHILSQNKRLNCRINILQNTCNRRGQVRKKNTVIAAMHIQYSLVRGGN